MIRTSVETKHNLFWTTEISTLKPWATSWRNECQAKPSEILVSWTSMKPCVFKRKVENVDSQSNNQKLNAQWVFRNDLIKHLRQKLKKCRFVAVHLTNYSFVQSRHPQKILQSVQQIKNQCFAPTQSFCPYIIFPALNLERAADRSLSLLESCANGRIVLPRYLVVEAGNLRR